MVCLSVAACWFGWSAVDCGPPAPPDWPAESRDCVAELPDWLAELPGGLPAPSPEGREAAEEASPRPTPGAAVAGASPRPRIRSLSLVYSACARARNASSCVLGLSTLIPLRIAAVDNAQLFSPTKEKKAKPTHRFTPRRQVEVRYQRYSLGLRDPSIRHEN